MKKLLFLFLFLFVKSTVAQDLNIRVQVVFPQVQTSDPGIFREIETTLTEFFNNRKWTPDNIQAEERIEGNFILTISSWDGASSFEATAQIQSTRPIYGSSYSTTLLNIIDRDFNFSYSIGQPIEFTDLGSNSNLSSLLAYYIYIIIGLDYDSFSPEGGQSYFQKAETIVSNSQSSAFSGWKAFENTRNRYWLTENLLNVSLKPIREYIYTYHRKGLDEFISNIVVARTSLINDLEKIQRANKERPNSMLIPLFFSAKADELTSLLRQASPNEKSKALNILIETDPSNLNKYQQILQN